jgi:hypothetical protein
MDSGGDEPDDEYEQHPCHWVELGLGAARILVPKHWSVESHDLAEATFAVAEIAGATFSVGLSCFEDPEAVRANALDSYLNHAAAPPLSQDSVDSVRDGDGKPDYEQLIVHYGCTEVGAPGEPEVTAEIDIWRCIHVAPPDHIRVAEFRFRTPMDTDPDFRRVLLASLRALVAETDWAPEPTKFDRVAPAEGLKLLPLRGGIYLRVPESWVRERENEDGTGRDVFNEPGRDRWTLWVDFVAYGVGDSEAVDIEQAARDLFETQKAGSEASEAAFDAMEDRPGEAMFALVSHSEEDGESLRRTFRLKMARTDVGVTLAIFNWIVPVQNLEDEDMPALSALVEREIRNALVIAPAAAAEENPPAPAPAGDRWKTVVLWDTVHLNVPEDAAPCFDDTDLGVLCKFDDPDREMWTLWVRMVRLPSPDLREVPDGDARRALLRKIVDATVETILETWAEDEETIHTERLPEPGAGFLAGMRRTHDSIDVNDGERLLHTDWHRIAAIGDGLFDLFFEWVIVERVAAEPAMRSLSERIAREVMQAGIVSS